MSYRYLVESNALAIECLKDEDLSKKGNYLGESIRTRSNLSESSRRLESIKRRRMWTHEDSKSQPSHDKFGNHLSANVFKVIDLLKKKKVDPEYVSPEYVADFAHNRGISLTSHEVVYASNTFESKITSHSVLAESYKMSSTYEIWDDDDRDHGDTQNRGFHYRDKKFDSLWELADEIRNEGAMEASSGHHADPHTWYSTEGEQDYHTGELTITSFHPEGLSNQDAQTLYKLVHMSQSDFRKAEPGNESWGM